MSKACRPRRPVAPSLSISLDDAAFGGATPITPKRINITDPASRWTAATREAAFYAYSTNYLIDLDHAVIVDVEATTSVRQAEVTAQRRMIERTQDRFGLWPERLVADAAYGSAPNLAWLVEGRSIEPHIPVFDKSARNDGSFERADFTYDREDDSYICPGDNRLRRSNRNFSTPRSGVDKDGSIRYRARQQDCQSCAFRQRGNGEAAETALRRALEVAVALGDRWNQLRLLGRLHIFHERIGDFKTARGWADMAVQVAERSPSPRLSPLPHRSRGSHTIWRGIIPARVASWSSP